MKEQSQHKPSMDYAKNIYEVASRMPKDFVALEIGSAWGFSCLAILEAGAKNILCVDPNTQAQAKNEAEANGYGTKCQWTVCRSDKFWEENPPHLKQSQDFSKASSRGVTYDLIYIDGSHLYRDVKPDLYEAWKRLDSHGLLMIDDFDHKKNQSVDTDGKSVEYGVSLACWEFWRDHVSEVSDVGIQGRVLWFKK